MPQDDMFAMPVAFGLLVYTATSLLRALHLVYLNHQASKVASTTTRSTGPRSTTTTTNPFPAVQSTEFVWLLGTAFACWIGYSYCVGQVEAATLQAARDAYNPYTLLGVPDLETNTTVLKEAFRAASQLYHPDHGGDPTVFTAIYTAYLVLTEPKESILSSNYQRYGHPDGPREAPALLVFGFPAWLVTPPESIALLMRVVQGVTLVLAVLYLVHCMRAAAVKSTTKADLSTKTTAPKDLLAATQTVAAEDMAYLTKTLSPTTGPVDILYAILSTPENIAWSLQDLDRVAQVRQARLAQDALEAKGGTSGTSDDGDFDAIFASDEGWADDDDDENDEHASKRKAAEAARTAERESLKQATGKAKQLLEGIDDGVLGQVWVEKTLAKAGQWPPADLGILADKTFDYQGQQVTALEHPGLRRVLCMTVGRLNSGMLNAHPQLTRAGIAKQIDQTYFGASMEFRQRVGMLLEAALRIAIGLDCHSLVATIVETVSIFKVGCQPGTESIRRFNALMQRQYLCLPHLAVDFKEVRMHVKKTATTPVLTQEEIKKESDDRKGTSNVEDIVAGGTAEFGLDLDRTFAENLFRQKAAALQKQGIPPQVALQSYREGWWVLLRYERLDGETPVETLKPHESMIKALQLDPATLAVYEAARPRLVTGWPLIIPNIQQKLLKVKIQFKAPPVPGKYRFYVTIKSQDFLGADQQVSLEGQVVEAPSMIEDKKEQ